MKVLPVVAIGLRLYYADRTAGVLRDIDSGDILPDTWRFRVEIEGEGGWQVIDGDCPLTVLVDENQEDPELIERITALAVGEDAITGGGAAPVWRTTRLA